MLIKQSANAIKLQKGDLTYEWNQYESSLLPRPRR